LVEEIREKATTWVPYAPEEHPLRNMSNDEIRGLLGTILEAPTDVISTSDLNAPESFDSRVEWPKCVHPIRD